MKIRHFLLLIAISVLIVIKTQAAQIMVFAAASLSDSLKEIGEACKKEIGVVSVFNFGASSLLARQIEEGAPADIFFSADEAKMDQLEKKALILINTRKSILSNVLVVVVAIDSTLQIVSPKDLLQSEVSRIALAEPRIVPAGIYAKSYLESLNLWPNLKSKVIPTENVRGALALVELGNADAGIVYKTDARISKKVRITYEVPGKECPKISYPMAVLKESSHIQDSMMFIQYLKSDTATQIFRKYGFALLD